MAVQKYDINTNKAARDKSDGVHKSITTKNLAGALLVLVAAVGIGMVIRELRGRPAEQDPQTQVSESIQPVEESKAPQIPRVTELPVQQPAPVEEVVVEPEPESMPPEPVQNEQVEIQDEQALRREQRRQDSMQWMSWFGSLTQEEQRVLVQNSIASFMSLMQRWQYMPQEEAQAERAQLEELFREFRNLPNEDRQRGIQAIQQQLEQMLQSGQQ